MMKVFKKILMACDLRRRVVLFFREGDKMFYAVILRNTQKIEAAGEFNKQNLASLFSFPRVLQTQFGAALPLEKACVQEWATLLRDRQKVRKVVPLELRFPCASETLLFDCVAGGKKGEEQVWHVVSALKEEVRHEVLFWLEQGISLDFLEWEGNIRAQMMKRFSKDQPRIWVAHYPMVSHVVAAKNQALMAQLVFLGSSLEQREKRAQIKQEALNETFQKFECRDALFPARFPQRVKDLFYGFLHQDQWFEKINFIQKELYVEMMKLFFKEKVSLAALFILIAVGVFQLGLEIEKWTLKNTKTHLEKLEEMAVQEFSQKTGLSKNQILDKERLKHLLPAQKSLLQVFSLTAEEILKAAGASYKGTHLEISPKQVILEGETSTFAEVEEIKEGLERTSLFTTVQLVQTQRQKEKVFFRLLAQRIP